MSTILRAFPFQPVDPRGEPDSPEYGMTLRDWFAGQALPAVIVATSAGQHQPGTGYADTRPMPVRMAHDAYKLADAMLAEREKGGAA